MTKEDAIKIFRRKIECLSHVKCNECILEKVCDPPKQKSLIEAYGIAIQVLSQKSARWIPIPYQLDYESDAKCSLCHSEFINAIQYNYCPNCGARMEADND